MGKNILDNMSGQELKEMIDNEIITLDELDDAALEKILGYETKMICHGSGDMKTICRCSEILNIRNGYDEAEKEKFISTIDKFFEEHVTIIDSDEPKTKAIKNRKPILRRIGLVAAIMAILMSVTVLVAAAFGVNIFEYISKIVRQEEGSQINVEQFTFHNGGETKKYSTIEEMVKSEGFNVLFPNKLPEGITVKTVTLNESVQGNDYIHITTNDANTCIVIELTKESSDNPYSDCITYDIDGKTYYIFQEETFFAICFYNNARYSIQTENYNDLIYIIDNMKE